MGEDADGKAGLQGLIRASKARRSSILGVVVVIAGVGPALSLFGRRPVA
jgi:hypothetical protein